MKNVSAIYINLEKNSKRRERMERQLRLHFDTQSFTRFCAITGDERTSQINKPELGCFLSHQEILENASTRDYTLVFEDDIILCADFNKKLNASLRQLEKSNTDWDILFLAQVTDIGNIKATYKLLNLMNSVKSNKNSGALIINCESYYDSACCAYVVNPSSKEKLAGFLHWFAQFGYPLPIDTCFLKLINQGRIKCRFVFPYLVGMETGGDSSIQSHRLEESMLMEDMINIFFIDSDNQKLLQKYIPTNQLVEENIDKFIASQILFKRSIL